MEWWHFWTLKKGKLKMYKKEFKGKKHTYTQDSKYLVCKTPRLCVYLQKKGFMFDKVSPDKKNPLFNVWFFKNSDELYDVVEDYFARKLYYK